MTDRAWKAGVVAVGVAAIALAGCEPVPGSDQSPGEVLEGVWAACLNDGAGDYGRRIAFFPDASYSVTENSYGTTDRTCGGATTVTDYEAWRYRLGGAVTAYVGEPQTEVLARSIDIMNSYVTVYSIVYQDASVTPPVLYFGDLALDPARDGTAPEKRPDVLSASTSLVGN